MKKLLALIMVAIIVVMAFAACGNKNAGGNTPAESTGTTEQTTTENEGKAEGNDLSASSPSEIIDLIYAQKSPELKIQTMDVDLSDADAVKSYTGLDDASPIKEAAASEALIGSQAYSLVLVRVKDAADAETVANKMYSGIDPRKWICVEADDMNVAYSGDLVMLIMLQSNFENISSEDIVNAFKTVVGTDVTLVSK